MDVSYVPRDVVKRTNERLETVYVRDPQILKLALKIANHRSELCNEPLRLFIRKSDGKTYYTEPHHLIPVSCQAHRK